jgi:hypothetical protein
VASISKDRLSSEVAEEERFLSETIKEVMILRNNKKSHIEMMVQMEINR